MSTKSQDNNYIVYKHTAPNGKVYIGITKHHPHERWANGFGYQTQVYFFRAIVKYGWDNIKHEILYSGLSEEEAKTTEIKLISEYKATDVNFGYNIDPGGDLHKIGSIARESVKVNRQEAVRKERNRLRSVQYNPKPEKKFIYKYDREGNLIQSFESVAQAAEDANIPTETLRGYVKRKRTAKTNKCFYSYQKILDSEEAKRAFPDLVNHNYNIKNAAINMYSISGEFIRQFTNAAAARKELGLPLGHIHQVCRGEKDSCSGYIWKYEDPAYITHKNLKLIHEVTQKQLQAIKEYHDNSETKTVYKYNNDGVLIGQFINLRQAAKDAGLKTHALRSRLARNIRNPKRTAQYSLGKFEDMKLPSQVESRVKVAVDMYDLGLNYLRTFECIEDAHRFLGVQKSHISDVCKGKRTYSNGYIWRYSNENRDNKNTEE